MQTLFRIIRRYVECCFFLQVIFDDAGNDLKTIIDKFINMFYADICAYE